MSHPCRGWPEGNGCLIDVADDWIWCRDCRRRRQEELAAGIGPMVKVGSVLDHSMLPELVCQCGGDPSMNLHSESLLHRQWAWSQSEANTDKRLQRGPTLDELRKLGL